MKKKFIIALLIVTLSGSVFIHSSKKTQSNTTNSSNKQSRILTGAEIVQRSKNAVVQVFAYKTPFNWLEPYKVSSQTLSKGSGFIYSEKGLIITNYHVIKEASFIQVTIPSINSIKLDVEIMCVSPENDIAVLKLTDEAIQKIKGNLGVTELTTLSFGNSDSLNYVHGVLALGYPLGQESLKSTSGDVSGFQRLKSHGYIQISTPINHGSSGGPSLNRYGLVIGVNTRGISSAQNVGYMIPINDVKIILNNFNKHYQRIKKHNKKLFRSANFFCVPGCDLALSTAKLARYLNNPLPAGAYIAKVFKNSVFDKFGIKAGSMLYRINGNRVDENGCLTIGNRKKALVDYLRCFQVGDTIKFSVYTNGNHAHFHVRIQEDDLQSIRTVYPEFEPQAKDYEVFAGMVVMNLSLNHVDHLADQCPHLEGYNKYKKMFQPRVIVTHILPGGQADDLDFRVGDIIKEVNGIKIGTVEDFRKAVRSQTKFLTVRKRGGAFAVFPLEKVLEDEKKLHDRYNKCYTFSQLGEQLRAVLDQEKSEKTEGEK